MDSGLHDVGISECTYSLTSDVSKYFVKYLDVLFFFQAEDGIRDLVRSRGLGDVYKRQDTW